MKLETTDRREYVLRGYMDAIRFTEQPCGRDFGTDLMAAINSDIDRFIGTIPTLSNFSIDQCERIGHDFWLTRNGHGAGFWDGDWDDADFVKRALTFVAYQGPFEISFEDSFYMDIG